MVFLVLVVELVLVVFLAIVVELVLVVFWAAEVEQVHMVGFSVAEGQDEMVEEERLLCSVWILQMVVEQVAEGKLDKMAFEAAASDALVLVVSPDQV